MLDSADRIKIKKDYNKIGTEDDPVIVAQRFLNIFRQLHIFTDERKQAFNQMILSQPPEIRGMFNSLPGGAVLQQYVDDLEAKNGIIRSIPDAAPKIDYEDEAKAKILATALAEANGATHGVTESETQKLAAQVMAETAAKAQAQAQALAAEKAAQEAKEAAARAQAQTQAQAQALAQLKAQLQNKINSAPVEDNIEKAPNKTIFQPISSTVTADASFAKEIASAIKEAINVTDDSRKKDSENLTKAIIDSQNKLAEIMAQNNSANIEAQNRLAQMLVQNNTANNASSSNNNANNIQINTAATFPPVEEMISGIVKVQSELFKEMAKTQTTELSAIISLALKESQQLSTQSIITAIKEMQKENLKFLQMHPIIYSNTNTPSPSNVPQGKKEENESLVKDNISSSPVVSENVSQKDDDVEDMLDEITGDDEISFDNVEIPDAEPAKKKKKTKKKKKKDKEGLSFDGITSSLLDKVSSLTDKVTSLGSKKDSNNSENQKDSLDSFHLTENEANNSLDAALFDDFSSKADTAPTPQENLQDENDLEDTQWEYVAILAEDATNNLKSNPSEDLSGQEIPSSLLEDTANDTSSESTQAESSSMLSQEWGYTTNDDTASQDESIASLSDASNTLKEEWGYDSVNAGDRESAPDFEDIQSNVPELASDTESNSEILTEDSSIADDEDTLSQTDATSAQIAEENTAELTEDSNWDNWDNADIADEQNPASENVDDVQTQDWEWEYEEVPEDKDTSSAEGSSDEGTDYSLETQSLDSDYNAASDFVNTSETETFTGAVNESTILTDTPMALDDAGNTIDDMNYESEKENSDNQDVMSADADSSSENKDWEWNYEEVPEGEEETSENTDEAQTNQDWEWDYEEVPEEQASASENTNEGQAGQDWEWDYEEVPEEQASASENTDEGQTDQDWEWDYEEVPEEQASASENADEGQTDQDWEWEYEEVPEEQASASENVDETQTDQDWEWDYEEVPEEQGETTPSSVSMSDASSQTADGDKILSDAPVEDPYRGEETNGENSSPLSSIYNSEVYFKDQVYQPQEDDNSVKFTLPDNLDDNFSISSLDANDETNEPYKPKTSI